MHSNVTSYPQHRRPLLTATDPVSMGEPSKCCHRLTNPPVLRESGRKGNLCLVLSHATPQQNPDKDAPESLLVTHLHPTIPRPVQICKNFLNFSSTAVLRFGMFLAHTAALYLNVGHAMSHLWGIHRAAAGPSHGAVWPSPEGSLR